MEHLISVACLLRNLFTLNYHTHILYRTQIFIFNEVVKLLMAEERS